VIFADEPAVLGSLGFRGAIFDVDGVLVDSPHFRAWADALRELMDTEWAELRGQTSYTPGTVHPGRVPAGRRRPAAAGRRSRRLGVLRRARRRPPGRALRRSQAGTPDHADRSRGVHAFPDAVRFVLATKAADIPIAAASSSKNADLLLRQVRLHTFAAEQHLDHPLIRPGLTLLDLLDADVSGRDLPRGKPDPMIFLVAAAELQAAPEGCFVVEDAAAGMQAAKAGRMAALGVARLADTEALVNADADLVVRSLDEVSRPALAEGRLARTTEA